LPRHRLFATNQKNQHRVKSALNVKLKPHLQQKQQPNLQQLKLRRPKKLRQ